MRLGDALYLVKVGMIRFCIKRMAREVLPCWTTLSDTHVLSTTAELSDIGLEALCSIVASPIGKENEVLAHQASSPLVGVNRGATRHPEGIGFGPSGALRAVLAFTKGTKRKGIS